MNWTGWFLHYPNIYHTLVDLCSFITSPITDKNLEAYRFSNEDTSSINSSPPPNETISDIVGPITRSRAKQLEKEMHSQVNANLVLNNQIILDDHMLLSTCFNVLRNDGVHEWAWDDDGFCPPNIWTKEPGRA